MLLDIYNWFTEGSDTVDPGVPRRRSTNCIRDRRTFCRERCRQILPRRIKRDVLQLRRSPIDRIRPLRSSR